MFISAFFLCIGWSSASTQRIGPASDPQDGACIKLMGLVGWLLSGLISWEPALFQWSCKFLPGIVNLSSICQCRFTLPSFSILKLFSESEGAVKKSPCTYLTQNNAGKTLLTRGAKWSFRCLDFDPDWGIKEMLLLKLYTTQSCIVWWCWSEIMGNIGMWIFVKVCCS